VATDPAGDQIADNVHTEKHAIDSKTFVATDMWTGGTGKFAGASGGGPGTCHPGEFKSATEGTDFLNCDLQGQLQTPVTLGHEKQQQSGRAARRWPASAVLVPSINQEFCNIEVSSHYRPLHNTTRNIIALFFN
jgi:hypothetical protein